MRNLINKGGFDNEEFGLYILAVALTIFGAFFSIYMSSCFCSDFGSDNKSANSFLMLGGFFDIVKVCSGMTLVSLIAKKKKWLKQAAIIIFLIFSTASFVASSATIATNLNAKKSAVSDSNEQINSLNKQIKDKEMAVDEFILQRKADLENNYRTRADSLYVRIKAEQSEIQALMKSKQQLKENDLSFLPILDVFNSMIPVGHMAWQRIITIAFGSLLEISGIFLLYLTYSLKHERKFAPGPTSEENPPKASKLGAKKTKINKIKISHKIEIPVSAHVYNEIVAKICSGNITPTQRAFKKEVRLGNEKISQIFKKLVADGVIVKEGKSYVLVKNNASKDLAVKFN